MLPGHLKYRKQENSDDDHLFEDLTSKKSIALQIIQRRDELDLAIHILDALYLLLDYIVHCEEHKTDIALFSSPTMTMQLEVIKAAKLKTIKKLVKQILQSIIVLPILPSISEIRYCFAEDKYQYLQLHEKYYELESDTSINAITGEYYDQVSTNI